MYELNKETYKEMLANKQLPETIPTMLLDDYRLREYVIKMQGYALVSWDWIRLLSEWIGDRKCLEIMAGVGTISYALDKLGVDIIPTDNLAWDNRWESKWINVIEMDAVKAIEHYGNDVDIIIMSWAYMDSVAYEVIQTMRKTNPNLLMIVIGEDWGGCTATDEFFDTIKTIDDPSISLISNIFPNWDAIHDDVMVVR